jgi:hypothetical protein
MNVWFGRESYELIKFSFLWENLLSSQYSPNYFQLPGEFFFEMIISFISLKALIMKSHQSIRL